MKESCGQPCDCSVEVAVDSWIVLAPLGLGMPQKAALLGLLRLAQGVARAMSELPWAGSLIPGSPWQLDNRNRCLGVSSPGDRQGQQPLHNWHTTACPCRMLGQWSFDAPLPGFVLGLSRPKHGNINGSRKSLAWYCQGCAWLRTSSNSIASLASTPPSANTALQNWCVSSRTCPWIGPMDKHVRLPRRQQCRSQRASHSRIDRNLGQSLMSLETPAR